MKNKLFTIKDTRKYGNGVYADKDIKKGEIIHVLSGKRLDTFDVVSRVLRGKENIDDIFQIGKRTYIDLDALSRTFNHSCNPTGGIRKTSELFALRDIKKGEELTYDYSLTIAPTDWYMKCMCGSKICRKKLGDVVSVPKKRRMEYRKLGALQRYMKEILKKVDVGTYKMPSYEKKTLELLGDKRVMNK